MIIAVTGGTGFVGKNLIHALLQRGDTVWVISRKHPQAGSELFESHAVNNSNGANTPAKINWITWDELKQSPAKLEGVEAIVNLAGESINQRWTAAAKERIMKSRQVAAERVAELVSRLKHKPSVVINASGISIYGTSETDEYDEQSPARLTDFLATVVEKWEEAADKIEVERLVKLRVSVVLGNKGGAFPLMALPYKLFAGGRVGSGKQWLSWIHVEDMTRLILFCLDHNEISGPVNASSPQPVTNDQFGQALGRAMKRPHWFPVPAFMMKSLFGEMATLLLDGQRVLPHKVMDQGFTFRYPTIAAAADELAGRQ